MLSVIIFKQQQQQQKTASVCLPSQCFNINLAGRRRALKRSGHLRNTVKFSLRGRLGVAIPGSELYKHVCTCKRAFTNTYLCIFLWSLAGVGSLMCPASRYRAGVLGPCALESRGLGARQRTACWLWGWVDPGKESGRRKLRAK